MREIKFKYIVKRKNGHIFSEIFTMKQIEFGEALLFLKINHVIEKELLKCQYTGLKDKNGKESYQGDNFTTESRNIYEIIFKNGSFGYIRPLTKDFLPMHHLIQIGHEWEIIEDMDKQK